MARGLTDAEMDAMDAGPGGNTAPKNPIGAIGGMPGSPPAAKGLTDAEMDAMEADPSKGDLTTPSGSALKTGLKAAGTGLAYGAKVLDVPRGALTAPLVGSALEGLTGKKVYSGQDYLNAINPLTTEKFPSSSEMMDRAGIPSGAKLSDYVPGYSNPGQGKHWFSPEKGGMLDPTLRGAGGLALDTATDPLTYLTLGAAGAEKKILESGAVANALSKNPMSMAEQTAAQALKPNTIGSKIGMAPQKAVGWLGDRFYGTPISPVLDQATKKGKAALDETLYRGGLATPGQTQNVVSGTLDKLGNSAGNILSSADAAGASTKLQDMLDPLKQLRAKLASTREPDSAGLVNQIDNKIKYFEDATKGTPAVPDQVLQTPSSILDSSGKPIMKESTIPGTPEVPGVPYSTQEATRVKTASGYKQNPLTVAPIDQQIANAQAVGSQKAVEGAVGESLGDQAEKNLHEINQARSGLLATRQGQATATAQANRLANRTFSPDGTSTFVGGLGAATGGLEGGAKAVLMKKLLDLSRMGSMPAGYAMKKLGESPTIGPLFDAWAKYQLEKKAGDPAQPLQPGGN